MKGFISYSHHDRDACVRMHTHLKALDREHAVDFWWDDRIHAGDHWSKEIEKAICAAVVFVLFASPDFVGSDYIWNKELPAIQERRKAGALVVPVVFRRCAWQMISGALQAVPTRDGRLLPIRNWRQPEDGLDRAREEIHDAVQRCFSLAPKPLFGDDP